MNYSNEIDLEHERFVDATVNVINASNLKSSVEVRGFAGVQLEGISLLNRNPLKPRSYAFICTQKDAKEKAQSKRLIEFGKRTPGDILIQYQRLDSSNGKLNLHFDDPSVKLTHILVMVDVRVIE